MSPTGTRLVSDAIGEVSCTPPMSSGTLLLVTGQQVHDEAGGRVRMLSCRRARWDSRSGASA